VSLSEAETHWREFIKILKHRGLHGVKYVVSDDHDGLKAALNAVMPGILWQRCQCHLQRNAACYVPKYEKTAPELSVWMEESLPEGLTVFALPDSHRKRTRTTNMLERVHEEINRRTRVAGLFPNEASLLRLVSAVLMELSEEWETGKRYLNMDVENSDSASERNKIYRKNVA
jgi:transposase-like protein